MNGYAAYQKSQNSTESARDIEFRLLGKVTGALIEAHDRPDPADPGQKTRAVLWNRDVWAALRVDLLAEDNALPDALKANLISLAIWVERETYDILDRKSDLDAIIEVNKTIMDGLKPAPPPRAEDASPVQAADLTRMG